MSSSELAAQSLSNLLQGLAEGVTEAQRELSHSAPIDATGRSIPQYHIPWLDFDIKVDVTSDNQSSSGFYLGFSPVSSSTQTEHISGSISGRLVSVPPDDGLPTIVLDFTDKKIDTDKYHLSVEVFDRYGELQEGQRVEINIDYKPSQELRGESLDHIKKVKLKDALLVSDEKGVVNTELNLAGVKSVIVVAEAGYMSAQIIVGDL